MLGAALAIGQGLYGAYNAIKSSQQANDYQAKMERMARESPIQKESPELANYYQQVSNRYNENPFTNPYYLERIKQGNRASANAIGQAQTRGAAVGMIGKINQGLMDNSNRGIAEVMQNKDAQLSQLGNAAQMRRSERSQLFDINEMTPYNRMLQLQQLKTQAANDRSNAGLSMAAQGVGNLAQLNVAKQMYPNGAKSDNVGKGLFDFFNFKNKDTFNQNADFSSVQLPSSLRSNFKYDPKGFKSYFGTKYQ
jgi:hypothetical protein